MVSAAHLPGRASLAGAASAASWAEASPPQPEAPRPRRLRQGRLARRLWRQGRLQLSQHWVGWCPSSPQDAHTAPAASAGYRCRAAANSRPEPQIGRHHAGSPMRTMGLYRSLRRPAGLWTKDESRLLSPRVASCCLDLWSASILRGDWRPPPAQAAAAAAVCPWSSGVQHERRQRSARHPALQPWRCCNCSRLAQRA